MTFLLAHLSDPHIGPLPRPRARELMGKRLTGFLNWQRRRGIHDMDVLARVVADIRAQNPDHVAMTGDILNIGLPAEFSMARAWLETLGNEDNVSFVPGNHDAYVRESLPLVLDTFAPWCASDGAARASFPWLRVRGAVALIGVSSAIVTAPFLASGRVGAAQLDALEDLLRATGERDLARVVLIHHPPWEGGASFGRGLRDARLLGQIIARAGAELVLHGHNHRLVRHILPGDGRMVPSIGVASASAVPGTPRHRAAWHLHAIDRTDGGWTITTRVRGFLPGTDEIGDIETFEA